MSSAAIAALPSREILVAFHQREIDAYAIGEAALETGLVADRRFEARRWKYLALIADEIRETADRVAGRSGAGVAAIEFTCAPGYGQAFVMKGVATLR